MTYKILTEQEAAEIEAKLAKLDRIKELLSERINQAEINFKDERLATQLREIRDAAGL